MRSHKHTSVALLSFLVGCAIGVPVAGADQGEIRSAIKSYFRGLGGSDGQVLTVQADGTVDFEAGGGGWTGTATSDLDMDGNNITGLVSVDGDTFLQLRSGDASSSLTLTTGGGASLTANTLTITGEVAATGSATHTAPAYLWSSGAGVSLSASDVKGQIYSNEGATVIVPMTLPAAAVGLHATWFVQDAQGFKIAAQSGDTIRISGAVSASGGYVAATAIGSSVHLVAINSTEWVAFDATGTWATDDETP